MNNEEKILALLEQHSEMFAQINSRLDKMDERLNRMDSQLDMIRNTLPGQKGGPYEENFCAYVGHCHGADHGGLRQESRQ